MADDSFPFEPKVTDSVTNHTKKKHRSFKETWEDKDILCTECGTVKIPAKGLTRQNISKLLSLKGNPTGWVMFFLMCMALFFAYTSWMFITAPAINCSNYSMLLIDSQGNINSNNQMPIIDETNLNILNLSEINNSYCQYSNPNAADYCQNISLQSNESI